MTDVYQAPEAVLDMAPEPGTYGSIERAVKGEYQCDIGEVLSEGWKITKGSKLTINLGMALYSVIALLIGIVYMAAVFAMISSGAGMGIMLAALLVPIVVIFIAPCLWAGMFMLGIKRSVGQPIAATEVISHFGKIIPLGLAFLLINIFTNIGYMLMLLPGIYLLVAYIMAIPLLAEKELGIWQSLEISRKSVTRKWFAVFGLLLVSFFVLFIASIPFFIGLIWAGPWIINAWGCLYRNMYGVEPR